MNIDRSSLKESKFPFDRKRRFQDDDKQLQKPSKFRERKRLCPVEKWGQNVTTGYWSG